ncbi:hypothetical protein BDDG_12402 [Blastomyces dermatitidis ATCC 18188]|uniref:Uncharacterized protein n=1 Tax=Ajellomyces dermatitidis (strain ATCC 18188 / CBS 674.68) TaxID=653446 RepID=A0A0J9ENM3_AJEDA|nr:hypothetical protein BDDG_12402 [Blastomyces dermatitidis ATCC 18188]
MLTFNDDLNQPIYYTAGNLMNLMQMMLQNQITAAEITQHLTTPVPAQRDTTRDELQKYQKEVKYALDIKSVTTFDDSNYEAWCVDMLTDIERHFHYLIAHYKELCQSTEKVYYNLFLNNLQNYQRLFIKTCLNEFFSTDQGSIVNIDIDDLMKQLINRTFKKIITEWKKQPQADSVTAKKNKDKDKDEDKSTPKKKNDKKNDKKKEKKNDLMSSQSAVNASSENHPLDLDI